MDYTQTIEYLFSKLPMFSRIGPAAFKKDLTNTLLLCERLGNPEQQFKSIHIAGTNGKGSVSHMLAAILQAAGYKTGLYTSPHLKDFRERIRINGVMIPEEEVVDFTVRMQQMIESIEPSFFEITVAMAFDYFARQQVDIAVIEVGLGGRLDSTNVVLPELSVITHIGYDHMSMLGDTLQQIAFEKAGIIKEGKPAVLGKVPQETLPVFTAQAAAKNAPLHLAAEQQQVADWDWKAHELVVSIATPHHQDHEVYHLDLPGIYQTQNLLTVLESVRVLQEEGWSITRDQVKTALRQVKKTTGLHARWELLHRKPDLVLEAAHNEDGIRQMVEQLELGSWRHLHIVMGLVKDKDFGTVFPLLPQHASYYFAQAHIPRAMETANLKQMAASHGIAGTEFTTVQEAVQVAVERAHPEDLVLVCGSIFLIAELEAEKIRYQ